MNDCGDNSDEACGCESYCRWGKIEILPKFGIEFNLIQDDLTYLQYNVDLIIHLTVIKVNFFAKTIFVYVVDKTQNMMEKNGLTTKQMKVLMKYNAMM